MSAYFDTKIEFLKGVSKLQAAVPVSLDFSYKEIINQIFIEFR